MESDFGYNLEWMKELKDIEEKRKLIMETSPDIEVLDRQFLELLCKFCYVGCTLLFDGLIEFAQRPDRSRMFSIKYHLSSILLILILFKVSFVLLSLPS